MPKAKSMTPKLDAMRASWNAAEKKVAKTKAKLATKPDLPGYHELADLVALLVEINIANVDHDSASKFVSCFTYGPKVMPKHWQRAIDARESLIVHRMVERQNRRPLYTGITCSCGTTARCPVKGHR